MCNRFHQSEKSVRRAFEVHGILIDADEQWPPSQIFPTGSKTPRYGLVVRRSTAGNRPLVAQAMEWGFPTKIRGKSGKLLDKRVTNARNLSSSLWKPSLAEPDRRCLVPFTWFAEPHPDGGEGDDGLPKQAWFRPAGADVSMFAGLWRETERGAAFAFCTTEPNDVVRPIHPKAMPAILHEDEWSRWLEAPMDEVLPLVRPFDQPMEMRIETPAR